MVVRQAAGFVPQVKPRVGIAADGTLAAIQEPERITLVELPSCVSFAEVGVDPEAGATDVAWIGTPPRLAVLSRYAAHSTVHLLDPHGPRTIAEIRLESPMKLCASVGQYALAIGAIGAAVLAASDTHLTPYQFPARSVPATAGAAGSQFVVALAGSIEEWDPHSRIPKRRLKLPRPAVITAVGGSDRVVWMTTQGDPTRLDVFALVNRGQPKAHDLPEPIAAVSSHPRSDLVACVGADTGRVYVVDLDTRGTIRTLGPEGIDRADAAALVHGRTIGVLAAQARRPITLVPLDAREGEPVPAVAPVSREAEAPKLSSSLYEDAAPPPPPAEPPPPPPPPAPKTAPATKPSPKTAPVSLVERFSSWRERVRAAQPRTSAPDALPRVDQRPTWRDDVVAWARAVVAGSVDRDPPAAPPIDTAIARLELAPDVRPALVLLYGVHLAGHDGAAPVDVARVLGRRWDEALGKGLLADRGAADYRDSRVRLATALQRVLDDLQPRCGTLVGTAGPITLLGPCAVVAPAEQPIGLCAEATLPAVGGAILAAHPHADARELVAEARAYGAVPMLRVADTADERAEGERDGVSRLRRADEIDHVPSDEPIILVVTDEALAEHLGIPRLG